MALPKETIDRLRAAWQRELAYADGVLAALRRNADTTAARCKSLEIAERMNAGHDFAPTSEIAK